MGAQRDLILTGWIDAPHADRSGRTGKPQLRHRAWRQANQAIIAHRPAIIHARQDRAPAVQRRHFDIAGQRKRLVRGRDRVSREGLSIGRLRALAALRHRGGIAYLIIGGRIGRTVKHTRHIIGFAQQDRLILDHGGRLRFSNGGHRAECRRDQGRQRLIA